MILPDDKSKRKILEDFNNEMKSYVFCNENTKELQPIFCASCDCIQTYDNEMITIPIDEFAMLCDKCNMDATRLEHFYPPQLLQSYCLQRDKRLQNYVLSPNLLIDDQNDTTRICNNCHSILQKEAKKKIKHEEKCHLMQLQIFILLEKHPKN